MMVKLKIILGKKLDKKFISYWNRIMLKTFKEEKPLSIKKIQDFESDVFFIIIEKNKIMSLGRLRPVKCFYNSKEYSVLGIADIVSLIKNKGYGKILMQSILEYVEAKKQIAIGFCLRENSSFYKKCGFKILKDKAKFFVYKTNEGKLLIDNFDNDVLYANGKDFIKKCNSKKLVFTSIPYW